MLNTQLKSDIVNKQYIVALIYLGLITRENDYHCIEFPISLVHKVHRKAKMTGSLWPPKLRWQATPMKQLFYYFLFY